VPNANIFLPLDHTAGGTNFYTASALPAGIESGRATVITVVANDTVGQVGQNSFTLTVLPALAYQNTDGPIIIPAGLPIDGTGKPYPSIIPVSGINGFVTGVRPTLVGFTHGSPQDVDLLLVSPDNKTGVVLMAHAGGITPVNGIRLTYDQSAAPPVQG